GCIGLILGCLSVLIYTQNLSVHGLEYRDDEIFYVKSTQQMLADHNWFSPTYFGENRFQKPILYYWFILIFYKIFGVSWVSARCVSVFFATLTVITTWILAQSLFERRVANLSAVVLMTLPLFFRHAKAAVVDMPFNFF